MTTAGDADLVDTLARVGIFVDADGDELRALAQDLPVREFPEGRWVLRQDAAETPGADLYIIVDGEAGVMIDDVEVARLTTGGFFGEVSVLLGEPPTADVLACTSLRCLVVPGDRVEEFLISHPWIMYRMLQTEARRLRSADRQRN